ncbi:hypothetical protein B9Z55_013327 [Caenorhabditis nigoni]|uniref:HTH CENPB-type domain-containing protein n=2 Tax=Caenorhabditis nigoni TaxID=1611254 RepID=A0A2G5U178_9PELO|nr:hypothetical protein B9Z55_013327 [Caenorhabditis nigoni]
MTSGIAILEYALACLKSLPKRHRLNAKDIAMAHAIMDILGQAEYAVTTVDTFDEFEQFDDDVKDPDWNPEDDEARAPLYETLPGQPNVIQFAKGNFVSKEKVEEAVAFYGSINGFNNNGSRKRPSFETMKRRFRFIENINHLQKIVEIEKTGEYKANRLQNLRFISDRLAEIVEDHLRKGSIMHDDTLRFFIAQIIEAHNLDIKFTPSKSWLNDWKRANRISSRKITKFVSVVRHQSKQDLEDQASDFVENVNNVLAARDPSSVWNADQSGFQLIMHTARTHARTGSKRVECVVPTVAATTHSLTVTVLASAAGELHPKLYVQLKEPGGKFPRKGHFTADNLYVTCGQSHIMTKKHAVLFYKDMLFHSSMPDDMVFVCDSWVGWVDNSARDSVTPSGYNVRKMVIPAGCTGMVQPCDVGIFGAFKKVVKRIFGQAQLEYPKYKIHTRDPTLQMLALVYWQFQNPKLVPWVQYAWHASGYDVGRPPVFLSPSEQLFPKDVAQRCSEPACRNTSFITCLYCSKYYCFSDFVISHHKCC